MSSFKEVVRNLRSARWLAITLAGILILLVLGFSTYFGPQRVGAELKQWQTLMAALVAIAAASIAYRAAMAKVGFDREIADREFRRLQLGVFLRLDAALKIFAGEFLDMSRPLMLNSMLEREFKTSVLRLTQPSEINEAWDNLDIFPFEAIHDLSTIRLGIKWINERGDHFGGKVFKFGLLRPSELDDVAKALGELKTAITNVQYHLRLAIDALLESK